MLLLKQTGWLFAVSICIVIGSLNARGQGNAEALMIVYPDYPINTDSFYGYTDFAGHAGVLLVREDGLTKYYEFGRYDAEKRGQAIRRAISNAKIANGVATQESLTIILRELSNAAGKAGRIRAAYFINLNFDSMNDFAANMVRASDPNDTLFDKKRKPYEIASDNCGHFAEQVILKGHPKIDKPTVINPTPNNFVDEYIEEHNAEVLFDPKTGKVAIGKGDEEDAKK